MSKDPAPIATRKRRSQEERSAASRNSLIESAIRHLRERGLAATNMTEIALDANLTRGAIQHHFSNRAELILAVIGELDARIAGKLEDYTSDPGANALERISGLIDKVIELTSSHDNIAVFDVWSASRSDTALNARTVELQKQVTAQFRRFWQRNLEGHMPDALIDMSFDVTLTMTQGGAMGHLLNHDAAEVDRMLRETKAMLMEFVTARL